MNQAHERIRGFDREPAKMTDNKNKPTGTSYAEIIQHILLNNEAYYVSEHKS